MLPAPGVRIVKIAIKDIARHFVIEAHVVVADDAGFWHREQIVNATGKGGFAVALGVRLLRRDPGNHNRLRLRQIVIGDPAVEDFGFADDIEVFIGADGGKLRRSVERRTGAEGLVIVKEKGMLFTVCHCLILPCQLSYFLLIIKWLK